MTDFVFEGATAVVTGAASGIGAELATVLARRGCRLVLVDRDADRLAEVAARTGATTHVVDLADREATLATGRDILAAHPRIRLLVNNAGMALGGRFDQVTLEEYEQVIDVNFLAPVRLTHLLLPALRAEPGAQLVLVSSVFGLLAPPGHTAYAASKFALRGFGESLRQELAGEVGVTLVHPGGIRTRIAESARVGSGVLPDQEAAERKMLDRLLTLPPERAAALIVDAVQRRRSRLLIGMTATVPDLAIRLAPVGAARLLRLAERGLRRLAARTR